MESRNKINKYMFVYVTVKARKLENPSFYQQILLG
jgi:hypothetical protein